MVLNVLKWGGKPIDVQVRLFSNSSPCEVGVDFPYG
jgi:hypothetical protein